MSNQKTSDQEDINNLTGILLRLCNKNGIGDGEFVIDLIENSLLSTDKQLVYNYFKNKLQEQPKFDVTLLDKVFKTKRHDKTYISKVSDIIFDDMFKPIAVVVGNITYNLEEFNEKFEEYKEN